MFLFVAHGVRLACASLAAPPRGATVYYTSDKYVHGYGMFVSHVNFQLYFK